MRYRLALAGAVVLGSAAAAGVTPAQQSQLTITVKPDRVVFSNPVQIEGRARGRDNAGILLQTSRDRASWTTIQRGRTAHNGRYTFGHRPSRNLYYRTLLEAAPQSPTPPVLVRVATLVGLKVSDSTARSGQRIRFSGIVRPPHNGRRVYLQRRIGTGAWRTIKRGTLRALDSKSSRYSISAAARSTAAYRTRVLGHGDHAMGISRERVVTVG